MAEEKIEKGVISEEALEEIAGGLKISGYEISKDTLKKVAIGAGVTVLGLAGLSASGYGLYKLGQKHGYKEGSKHGVEDGHQVGYMVGFEKGYNTGRDEGGAEGYERGLHAASGIQ